MNTFDDRKKAFESKYANDAEMQFKVMAKRNKFVGLCGIFSYFAPWLPDYSKSPCNVAAGEVSSARLIQKWHRQAQAKKEKAKAAEQEAAAAAGVKIVHSCGFDSVPSDLGCLVLQEYAIATHGRHQKRCAEPVHHGVLDGRFFGNRHL